MDDSQDATATAETLDSARRQIAALQTELTMIQRVIDDLPYAIYWKDRDLVYRGANRRFIADMGLADAAAIVGRTDDDLPWQPGEAEAFKREDRRLMADGQPIDRAETVLHPDGAQEWFETSKLPLRDTDGAVIGVVSSYLNITARKLAERTVQQQAELLDELSTPIIPISDEVLVVPAIGHMDTRRVGQMMQHILEAVAARHTTTVILDITGVPLVDTHAAQGFITIGQALQLIGARLILTGIRPEVAQAIVGLGIGLRGIVSYSTLQQGLQNVFQRAGIRQSGPRS